MSDLNTKILEEIRDESRGTRRELEQTNQRLEQTNQRLERLERRQVEAEVRLATELTTVVGAIRDLKDAIVADRDLRRDIADHEQRLRVLEAKTG